MTLTLLTNTQGDDQKDMHIELSNNINNRLDKAMGDIKGKHAKGTSEVDHPDRQPTGYAYREQQAKDRQKIQREKMEGERLRIEEERSREMKMKALNIFSGEGDVHQGDTKNDETECDSDDEYDHLLDDSLELEAIREQRIHEMREAQSKEAEQKSLGHGQYRTICQDEFLKECAGSSEFVAIHFFHKEFERCKVMDYHLEIVATQHISCKFLRIDAEKAPFFVSKLQVKTLPSLFIFQEGKVLDKLTGFSGLALDQTEPDKWHTGRLQQWIANTGAIKYKVPTDEILEEMKRMGIKPRGAVWSGNSSGVVHRLSYNEQFE